MLLSNVRWRCDGTRRFGLGELRGGGERLNLWFSFAEASLLLGGVVARSDGLKFDAPVLVDAAGGCRGPQRRVWRSGPGRRGALAKRER